MTITKTGDLLRCSAFAFFLTCALTPTLSVKALFMVLGLICVGATFFVERRKGKANRWATGSRTTSTMRCWA